VHLNHGSFGAVPIPVQKEQDRLRRRVETNPMKYLSRALANDLDDARGAAARFLHAEVEGFVFVPNATTGVNTVLASMSNLSGGEVLVTDQTYGAVRFAAERMCRAKGAKLVVVHVPLPIAGPGELLETVLSGVTGQTRLAIVDHIASPTGLVFPIFDLVARLHEFETSVLVDGAHAPGMFDLDLDRLNVDFWTGNFHKWCCAPRGSAGLWVREDHRKAISPLITSWYVNDRYPSSFRWLGTNDYTPFLATPAALKFMEGLGWDRIRVHNRRLARLGRDMIESALGTVPVIDPKFDTLFEAMTLVGLPDGVATTDDEARSLQVQIAEQLSIEALPLAWNNHGYLRLSAEVYNSPADFERLSQGVPHLLGKG
jgi:isopenicillin-N epimerase